MRNLYWLTDEQMERLRPFFPKSHIRPWVNDRRLLSEIIFVNRNGLRWRDAPKDYGPAKTLTNRRKRWGATGVFDRMMEGLAAVGAEPKTVMIDVTYLTAHRTTSSLAVKKEAWTTDRPDQRRREHQVARTDRCEGTTFELLPDRRAG